MNIASLGCPCHRCPPQEKTFRELKTEGGIKSFHQHNEFSDIPKMLSLMF
jgi:hypothetical protein